MLDKSGVGCYNDRAKGGLLERRSDTPRYVIRVAARLAGVAPHRLRSYERAGLIRPTRTGGNIRLYSDRDLERVERISVLVEQGINLAGVRVILEMNEERRSRSGKPEYSTRCTATSVFSHRRGQHSVRRPGGAAHSADLGPSCAAGTMSSDGKGAVVHGRHEGRRLFSSLPGTDLAVLATCAIEGKRILGRGV